MEGHQGEGYTGFLAGRCERQAGCFSGTPLLHRPGLPPYFKMMLRYENGHMEIQEPEITTEKEKVVVESNHDLNFHFMHSTTFILTAVVTSYIITDQFINQWFPTFLAIKRHKKVEDVSCSIKE